MFAVAGFRANAFRSPDDGDVGGTEGGVPGGVVLGGGVVPGAGLEHVGDGNEVIEHRFVGGAAGGGEQGGVGQDGAGLGADGAGGGFEDEVVGDGGGLPALTYIQAASRTLARTCARARR